MDWKTYRHLGATRHAGLLSRGEQSLSFDFLPAQGPGRRFNYVPGAVVVPAQYDGQVSGFLRANGFTADGEFAGVIVYRGASLPKQQYVALLEEANTRAGGDAGDVRVAPLHALAIQDHGDLGPAGPPVAAGPLGFDHQPVRPAEVLAGTGVKVGVLDTGVYRDHPMLRDHLDPGSHEPINEDVIEFDPDTGHMKRGVGHGTFVAGVVLRCAPGATIFARRVVDSDGVTQDLDLAAALDELGPKVDILCVPLGGYTMNDRGPYAILTILEKLYAENDDLVVVAAAGNGSRRDPFWPAADHRVIGVGALDDNGERAGYSNYGPWVDTYALGTDIHSAFVNWEKSNAPVAVRQGAHHAEELEELQELVEHMDRNVEMSNGPWATWSGTSFAAPVVAGAIAAAMRPADGPPMSARKAAFDVTTDPRLGRQTAAGSLTEHTFLIQPAALQPAGGAY